MTMGALDPFVPLAGFVLAVLLVLLVTAPDLRRQLLKLHDATANLASLRHRPREALVGLVTIKRMVWLLIAFCLVSYIWTYQSIKEEVRTLLVEKELEGVVNPIMMKVYQAAGGGGMPEGGMPGGGMGGAPGGGAGPTVEEVD